MAAGPYPALLCTFPSSYRFFVTSSHEPSRRHPANGACSRDISIFCGPSSGSGTPLPHTLIRTAATTADKSMTAPARPCREPARPLPRTRATPAVRPRPGAPQGRSAEPGHVPGRSPAGRIFPAGCLPYHGPILSAPVLPDGCHTKKRTAYVQFRIFFANFPYYGIIKPHTAPIRQALPSARRPESPPRQGPAQGLTAPSGPCPETPP